MNLEKLNDAVKEEDRGQEAIMIYYTKSDIQEMLERDLSDEQWDSIVRKIDKSDFYDTAYERIRQISEYALEEKQEEL